MHIAVVVDGGWRYSRKSFGFLQNPLTGSSGLRGLTVEKGLSLSFGTNIHDWHFLQGGERTILITTTISAVVVRHSSSIKQ